MLARRFKLVRTLGEGAMGRVWLARDTHLNEEPVACKLLSGALIHDRRAVACLKREVLLTRRLRHPHIVAVHTFWDADGLLFITMEYLPGRSLADVLADREQPFAITDVLPWARDIGEALDHAHAQGVLHRDVKPANMVLGEDGTARLADFGIARTITDMRTRITGGVTCGTVMFMSPEQLMGEPIDGRSDQYSMAASVYELLAGMPPFYTGSVVTQIQSKPAPHVPHLPERVNAVLRRALAKRPEDRYDTCLAFHEELHAAVCESEGWSEPPKCTLRRASDPEQETVRINTEDMCPCPDRLGTILLDAGAITDEQLGEALEIQRDTSERLGAVLKRLGHIDELTMAQALERQLQLPLANLGNEKFDPDITYLVGASFARGRKCIPIRREAGCVLVAMADPLDFNTINILEEICLGQIALCVATDSDILEAVAHLYGRR